MDRKQQLTALSLSLSLSLSLFVLPGAGHWYLGRRTAGAIYAALSTAWTRESPALIAGLLALLLCWLVAAADLLRR